MSRYPNARILLIIALLAAAPVTSVPAQVPETTSPSAEAREMGIREIQTGRFGTGYALLVPWVRANSEDLQARFYAAWGAAFLGRTFEAAELLTGLDEDNPGVQFLWGKLLLDKGDPQGAIETLAPLVGEAPEPLELDVRRLLAKAHMEQGEADQAVLLLEGRVGGNPALALDLALAKLESGEVEQAEEILKPFAKTALETIDAVPESQGTTFFEAGLVYEYGRILINLGQHSAAVPFLEASVRAAAECKQCWLHLAQSYAAVGNRSGAKDAQARFEEMRRTEASLEEIQRQAALDQRDPTGKVVREAAEVFEAGRPDAALAMLRAEGQLRPEDPRTLNLAAQILTRTGRAADALGLAERAVRVAPGSAESFYVRGLVLRALGQADRALQDFEHALELAPDYALAAAALDELSRP